MGDISYVSLQILIWFVCAAGSAVAVALVLAAAFASVYLLGLLQAVFKVSKGNQ